VEENISESNGLLRTKKLKIVLKIGS